MTLRSLLLRAGPAALAAAALAAPALAQEGPRGWLSWRGPAQNGTSSETGLPGAPQMGDGGNVAWTYEMAGRGTPVIADGRLFGLGYDGKGPTLQEVLFCLDAATGEEKWSHRFPDFISDVIYTRYAIGAPTVDPDTGNVFALTGAGLVHAFTPDGEMLWQNSMMETLGRLTFPNGRTGAPLIVGDLVIVHFIFAAWGPDFGPARDRFYAFDKRTGEVVWGATPGGPPKDSSFSMPIVEIRGGRTVFYAGLGGGFVCCVDALTGDVVWRFPFSIGGINSSALIHGDKLVVIHGKENRDSSVIGRMIALDLTAEPDAEGNLPASAELWRSDLVAFTSSPTLVGDTVFATTLTGELNAVDVATGEVRWHEKLGDSQLHASPAYADGKLYVPLADGTFHVLALGEGGAESLGVATVGGSCLGAPAISGGRVYVHSTDRLVCFEGEVAEAPVWPAHQWPADAEPPLGPAKRLQLVPFDQTVRVGDPVAASVRALDAHGRVLSNVEGFTANVVARQKAPLAEAGESGAWTAANPGAGTLIVSFGDDKAEGRLRVVPKLPLIQDFSGFTLNQADGTFAFPPGEWLGGRLKWQIVERDGEKMLMRNMSNPLFQRTLTLFGHPDDSNYTVQVDVQADGDRRNRVLGWPGVVNQRYLFILKGSYRQLEVSSNMEHFKEAVPFKIRSKTWYTMKTRVDIQPDGSAIVRGKVWPRDEDEPEAWTIEATDPHGHTNGAAGLYGFTPQSRFTVYMDNLSVTPND
ncbi:MAG: PQQ-binding-like beta-propeller repeat protein [Planctomycetota bacterium]